MAKHDQFCLCQRCVTRWSRQQRQKQDRAQNNRERGSKRRSNWSPPMGGSDADGNPVTVSFGRGPSKGHTLLSDGDQSEGNFLDSANHDHYGSGKGPNNNGTRRGKYTGRGS